jgi:hypothetical protein
MKRINLPSLTSLLLLCLTAVSSAQIETTQRDNNLTIQLPNGELIFATSLNGRNESNNWIGPSFSNFSEEGAKSSFSAVFAEGATLSFERILETSGDTINAKDSWTIDSPVTGHIHYEITLPMDASSQTVIEAEVGSMSLAELSAAKGMEYFLRTKGATTLTIRNYLGADLAFQFNDPGNFEVMTVEHLQIVHLRFFVDPESSSINDFQTGWSLKITPAK